MDVAPSTLDRMGGSESSSAAHDCGSLRTWQRNATQIELRQHDVISARLPEAFDGFTLLQLSDLHVEMSEGAMMRLAAMLPDVDYDLCVLTGDYRAQTFGAYEPALAGMEKICSILKQPVYGVLGNHDTIRMVPGLEDMGIRMLLNENQAIDRGDQQIYLAGIDDAHFYRVDNIEKGATGIPVGAFSILLSHTPEVYQQASYADFSLLLGGHTHGGQICLPGRIPITLDSAPGRSHRHSPVRGHGQSQGVAGRRPRCARFPSAMRHATPAPALYVNATGVDPAEGADCIIAGRFRSRHEFAFGN